MSYLTLKESDDFFSSRIGGEIWVPANPTLKTKALQSATDDVNRLAYKGSKTSTEQDNEFPRDGSEVVPTDVKRAVCYIALEYVKGNRLEDQVAASNVLSDTIGPVRTTYRDGQLPAHVQANLLSATAFQLLSPYLIEVGTVRLDRVS